MDFITLYFFSLVLFVLPLFFGKAYLVGARQYVYPEIETYVSYGVAFIGCLLVALFSDGVRNEKEMGSISVIRKSDATVGLFYCFFSLFFALVVVSFVLSGFSDARNKSQALDGVGVEYMVMGSLLVSGYLVALISGFRFLRWIFLSLAIIVFFVGSRSPLVFMVLGWFFVEREGASIVLIRKGVWLLVSALALLFVVLGKSLYGYMYSGAGLSTWIADFNVDYFESGAEFLRTNGILNSVVVHEYTIPWSAFFLSFLKILPFSESFYSFEISYFANNFQSDVFPWIDYGIAFNPFAEAYSWGGVAGVFLYSLIIPVFLSLVWRCYLFSDKAVIKSVLIIVGVVVAFWIHRNTIGSTFGYIRNIIYPSALIYFFSFAFAAVLRSKK